MEGSVSHYNATRTFSFYFVGATDCNSPAFHQVNRVMGRPQLKPFEFQAFALTCVEDHEIIGGSSLQQASVHMDVVSHSHRAVSECSEGHATDCTAVPGERHCWQSKESMSAGQGWRLESCTERKEERNKACGRCPYPFSSSFFYILTYVKAVDSWETLSGIRAGWSSKEVQLPSHNTSQVCKKKKEKKKV